MPQDPGIPPLLRVCPACARSGRLHLQPDPPDPASVIDPDELPVHPRLWLRLTAILLLALMIIPVLGALHLL